MNQIKSLLVTLFVALVVIACGGGGGSDNSGPQATTASVAITTIDSSTRDSDELLNDLMDEECEEEEPPEDCIEPPVDCDEPEADPESCEDGGPQLLVTIVQVVLLGEDNPNQEIFSGEEELNLFELKEGFELKFLKNGVPPGTYSKIRLIVEGDAELINDEYPEGIAVKVPTASGKDKTGKIDLNPKESFELLPGDNALITLDWHANKAIKYEAGKNLILRPVIFVDVDVKARERIVRVSGIVGEEITPEKFDLCLAVYVEPLEVGTTDDGDDTDEETNTDDCIDIIVTDKTGIFDENGAPQAVELLETGDPVTVIGLLREVDETVDECAEAMTPEDECPIVNPLTVAEVTSSDSDNGNRAERHFEIVAGVVEEGLPGTWQRFRGTLETAPDGLGEFDFRLSGPEGRLLTGQVFDGDTRIFLLSKEDGITEISAAELAIGNKAIVEAVFIPGDDLGPTPKQVPDDCSEASIPEECLEIPEKLDGTLRISLMLVRMGDDGGEPSLPDFVGGKLKSADADTGELVIANADLHCVMTDEETAIFQVFKFADDVEAVKATVGELIIGSLTLASGTQNTLTDCLDAEIVVSEGDLKKPEPEPTP